MVTGWQPERLPVPPSADASAGIPPTMTRNDVPVARWRPAPHSCMESGRSARVKKNSRAYPQPLSRASANTSTVANAIHAATQAMKNAPSGESKRSRTISHPAYPKVTTFPISSVR